MNNYYNLKINYIYESVLGLLQMDIFKPIFLSHRLLCLTVNKFNSILFQSSQQGQQNILHNYSNTCFIIC
jgi:hypothetical protein